VRRAVSLAAALAVSLVAAGSAQAQFGVERHADPFQDGWIAQVFADDDRIVNEGYSNGGPPDPEGDSYPVAGRGTGIYELAGGHPFIGVTDFTLRRESANGPPAGGNPTSVRVDIPRGLMPNPGQFMRCTDEQLSGITCPRASQIGTQEMVVYIPLLSAPLPTGLGAGDVTLKVPLYNMTPLSNPNDPGDQVEVPARFGFNPAEAAELVPATDPLPNPLAPLLEAVAHLGPIHIVGGMRDAPSSSPSFGPADHGLLFRIDHLPLYDGSAASPGVLRSNLTFWGVPGDDAAHAAERAVSCVLFETPLVGLVEPGCTLIPPSETPTNPDPDPETPFLTNPTYCGGVDENTRLSLWSHAGAFDQLDDPTPAVVDIDDGILKHGGQECERNVPFDSELVDLDVDPQVTAPDSPSGAAVSLLVQQPGLHDKDEFSTSHVKDILVTLPPGLTINPSVANGLAVCTDAQFAAAAGTPGGEACPEASRIGTTSAISPLLPNADDPLDLTPGELSGAAYVGQPLTGDMYRLFVTVEGRGISIRLKGSVKPNPDTGQLTATFANNPQLPFSDLSVDLRDGARAPLATPLDCGSKAGSATLTPWSGTSSVGVQSAPFGISGAGCPPAFAPTFGAGTASALAGAFSALSAQIDRADRNQFLSGVRVEVPPGFAGMISRVTQCADAQAVTGACPASSRVGTVHTRSGAGSEPFALSGPVYLSGPYKGGSFGLVAVIRAIAGPYDLGTVVVRQAIYVDPNDAHLSVISDPLPRILKGVPIRLRLARVVMDKAGFTFNPTSCGAKQLTSRIHSTQGAGATPAAAPFSIGSCERLPLDPKLSLSLTGPRQMAEGKHPGVNAALTQRAGESNIKGARVTLPLSLALDPDNARGLCEYDAGLKGDCPASSIIGRAKAVSPALNKPLTGPVHFVKGVRFGPTGNRIRTLPTFFVPLRGEVPINLRSQSSIGSRGRLVNTFTSTPDAPVSRFELKLKGGKGGILVVTSPRGACRGSRVASVHFDGHNGKAKDAEVALTRPCKKPGLKVRKKSWRGDRIVVRGVIAKAAKRKVSVTARCGKTRVTKAKKPKRGRWKVALPARGRCGDASRARLVVKYPGGDQFRPATRRRAISRSAP
jgi:hypothetical protein